MRNESDSLPSDSTRTEPTPIRVVGWNLALFAVYFITARLGLKLGAVSGFATAVWPPTGIALAALLLFGPRLWPGIALGAFLVNWSLGAPLPVALAMGAGNTLEAVVGAALLRRARFHPSLERLSWVTSFILFGAILSTLISATIGVASLALSEKLTASPSSTWLAWWLGDMMGDLVVAPFLLVWGSSGRMRFEPKRSVEAIAQLALVITTSLIFFTDLIPVDFLSIPRPYLAFPVIMLAAVRFGQPGTVSAVLFTSIIATGATVIGHGRFGMGSLSSSLLETQVFFGVLSISEMVLAAASSERNERQRELRRAVRARDEFVSIASHELKTPLTSLMLQTQMRRRNLAKGAWEAFSPDRLPKMIADDERQIVRLTRLVDDMLDVSRMTSGGLQLAPEDFDLSALIREVMERFRSQLQAAGIETTIDAAAEIVGNWDRYRIEQVFTNLLTNALKYGGGKPISVAVRAEPGFARLVVRDQGIGIEENDQARIFRQFERAVSPTGVSGLGLGLYIVKQIVDAHGGRIQVESALGQGSTFTIDLPRETPPV